MTKFFWIVLGQLTFALDLDQLQQRWCTHLRGLGSQDALTGPWVHQQCKGLDTLSDSSNNRQTGLDIGTRQYSVGTTSVDFDRVSSCAHCTLALDTIATTLHTRIVDQYHGVGSLYPSAFLAPELFAPGQHNFIRTNILGVGSLHLTSLALERASFLHFCLAFDRTEVWQGVGSPIFSLALQSLPGGDKFQGNFAPTCTASCGLKQHILRAAFQQSDRQPSHWTDARKGVGSPELSLAQTIVDSHGVGSLSFSLARTSGTPDCSSDLQPADNQQGVGSHNFSLAREQALQTLCFEIDNTTGGLLLSLTCATKFGLRSFFFWIQLQCGVGSLGFYSLALTRQQSGDKSCSSFALQPAQIYKVSELLLNIFPFYFDICCCISTLLDPAALSLTDTAESDRTDCYVLTSFLILTILCCTRLNLTAFSKADSEPGFQSASSHSIPELKTVGQRNLTVTAWCCTSFLWQNVVLILIAWGRTVNTQFWLIALPFLSFFGANLVPNPGVDSLSTLPGSSADLRCVFAV